jgi:protease I
LAGLPDRVRSWNFTDWDRELPVDVSLAQAKSEDFDALLLPGGVINPDALRIQPKAVAFVKAFFLTAASLLPPYVTGRGP